MSQTSEPLSDERITEIRARVEATTPGPWESETAVYGPLDSVHIAIRTRDKLPEHPWSPRFVAWMTGAIAPVLVGHAKPLMRHCDACDRTFYRDREVPIDVRADEHTQADAAFIAHAPTDVRDLLAENARLRAALEDARGDIAFLQRCLTTASETAAKALAVVRVVAEADNSDSSVCYQLCQYDSGAILLGAVCGLEHSGPCVVEQARALLAPTPDASAQGTEGSEASSDDVATSRAVAANVEREETAERSGE